MQIIPSLKTLASLSLLTLAGLAMAETVQVDIRPLLNARIVTTLTDGKLVTWRDSLDNAGSGMATQAAAAKMGDAKFKALPDDGIYPANDRHPLVKLHFTNADGSSNQVRRSIAADAYDIAVPSKHYRSLALFCMSGMGASQLTLTLKYADGSTETRQIEAPDWWNTMPKEDSLRYDLGSDMGKWDDKNKLMETDHHYLTGLELRPNPSKALTLVRLEKTAPGVLTLWGVTGQTE